MRPDPEYIFQLMTEKLAGTISAIDEQYLDELIEQNEVVREKWELMQGAMVRRIPEERSTVGLPKAGTRSVIKRLSILVTGAAAISAGVWYFFLYPSQNEHKQPALNSVKVEMRKGVRLKLAGGEVVNLGDVADTIHIGSSQLITNRKTLSFRSNDQHLPAGSNELVVPVGLTYRLLLEEGSEIWLNSATSCIFPFRFSANKREIKISGEAYLKISPDHDRPFIVATSAGKIEVLGTTFNVNTYDSGLLKVALVEGVVKLRSSGGETMIKPGQEGIASAIAAPYLRPFEEKKVLGWLNGTFYFKDATLQHIATVIPRWFGIAVQMDNSEIAEERFTGSVNRNLPIKDFLESLKATTTVQYYFDENEVLHFR